MAAQSYVNNLGFIFEPWELSAVLLAKQPPPMHCKTAPKARSGIKSKKARAI
jgi:hypothetical protein